MKIGILGAADIAFRRFLPALKKCPGIEYAGVASRTLDKAVRFSEIYGGQAYPSYDAVLEDKTIDAVYVPLPPALHFEWGKKALLSGKHLIMEKPFTTTLTDTKELLQLSEVQGLAVHENYMFLYHSQLQKIRELISEGIMGSVRLFRMSFGFPKRADDDFRYNKALGGGALLDCGGYTVCLAREMLGETARVIQARLIKTNAYEVDLFGNAVLENNEGMCAQVGFGMDNAYQCQLEVWGSKAVLSAPRIFTAPDGFAPELVIQSAGGMDTIKLSPDDSFEKSLRAFIGNVQNPSMRGRERERISWLSNQVKRIMEFGGLQDEYC